MSDLPDYQRNIQVVAGDVNVAEYDATPEDITDGTRAPLLIDNKGRLEVLADIRKILGYDVASGYGAGILPIHIAGGLGYNPCWLAWQVDLVRCAITLNTDPSDRAARLLGKVYGSRSQQLQQKASTYELLTYDSFLETKLGGGLPAALDTGALKIKEQSPLAAIKLWDGTYYVATPGVGDAIARGLFLYGSDYGSPTPAAQIVKVDSSGRLSCVLG